MTTPSRRALLAGTAVIAWATFAAAAQAVTYTDVGFAEKIAVTETGMYRISVGGGGTLSIVDFDPDSGEISFALTSFGAQVAGDLFMRSGSRYSVLVGENGFGGGAGASMFTYASSRSVVGAERAVAGGSSQDGNPGQAEPLGSGEGGVAIGGGGGGGLYGYGGTGEGAVGGEGGAPLTGSALGGGYGGFGGGGGGGGVSQTIAFGGGGGFTGGNGGYSYFSVAVGPRGVPASGGGSYLSPAFANQTKITGGATGGAFVSVDLIAPIPAPGALGLIGSAMAGLVLAARRRKRED